MQARMRAMAGEEEEETEEKAHERASGEAFCLDFRWCSMVVH